MSVVSVWLPTTCHLFKRGRSHFWVWEIYGFSFWNTSSPCLMDLKKKEDGISGSPLFQSHDKSNRSLLISNIVKAVLFRYRAFPDLPTVCYRSYHLWCCFCRQASPHPPLLEEWKKHKVEGVSSEKRQHEARCLSPSEAEVKIYS